MRIGLASDSHGNETGLGRALEVFEGLEVDRVFFLGGRLADLDAVLERRRSAGRWRPPLASDGDFLDAVRGALFGAGGPPLESRVVRVASRDCPGYAAGLGKHVDLVEGRICCLVHDKADLTREDILNASILFHGASARPGLTQFGPRVFVTPGHLRSPPPDGAPATFAVVEVDGRGLALTVYGADGAELRTERATFGAGGKLSVR
jgi:predicted phosphodiesterase